jgi:hypothetical protein
MSSLTSNSTIAEVKAAYVDNASYDEDGSVTKARAFITAVRIMLSWPKRERLGGGGSASEFEVDTIELRRQLDEAKDYVAANRTDDPSPAVLDVDFSEFDART